LLDINEIKGVQQRLQESGDYARSIVDTVRDPLVILGENLRIQSANLSYYRLFGAKPQDVEGNLLEDVAGGLWRIPGLLALLKSPDLGGPGFENFEINTNLSQGPSILSLNARRFPQEDLRKNLILLAIKDITSVRRAERDVRLLKYFSDQSPFPFYLVDKDANFTYVNRSACLRLNYLESDLLIHTLHRIEPACTPDSFRALFQRVHAGEIPLLISEHQTKEDKRFPVECSITGVVFEGDEFMLVVARDITERIIAEEALQLSEEKLRQSQRMEAIGKLAGGVAHDFNNLLTAINGYSALCLAEAPEEGSMHDNLGEISRAGERAAALTRQLLAYSRKQLLMPQIINLNGIVTNIHNMLSRLIGSHISITLSLDESLGLVKADPGQMEQVLINLVVNARDALPHGGEIILKTRNVEFNGGCPDDRPYIPDGEHVLLSVADNGVGMTPDQLNHIFDPFYTTKGLGKGTGLGLSVVQGIVSQSEGCISVDSVPGAGSDFKIYLPRNYSGESQTPKKTEDLSLPYRGIETVLLVEDEQSVRKFTRKILELRGYSVLEANNGQTALLVEEQHKGTKIHLLLTDMVMPGMNGRELADRFLAIRPGSGVLLMSGYTEASIFDDKKESGRMARFIPKPFAPEALAKAVRETLDFIPATAELKGL
nr:ATP-binding protein [Fibrobacterota bacterium]